MSLIPASTDPKKKQALDHMVKDGQMTQSDREKYDKSRAGIKQRDTADAKAKQSGSDDE